MTGMTAATTVRRGPGRRGGAPNAFPRPAPRTAPPLTPPVDDAVPCAVAAGRREGLAVLSPQPAQQLYRDLVQGDRAAAAGRLGRPQQVLAVDHHDLLVHGERRRVEVDVAPPQRGDLTAAQ